MASAIDGLVSGLDTTTLIANLLKIEAAPQTLLKSKQSTTESRLSALQGLNTKLASLAETAKTAAKPASWTAYTATSSSAAATVKAGATAQTGSLTFSVDRVAKAQVSVSDAVKDDKSLVPAIPPAVTIRNAEGAYVTVSPTTGSLADIAKAINDAADSGIRATVVLVSNGAQPEYRIQFTGTTTGTDFAVFAGTQAEVEALGSDPSSLRIDKTTAQAAETAQITLWKGVAGLEKQFSQASNTFSNVMTGVDVTVSKVTAVGEDPTTVTVARDGAALQKLASDLVASLNVALSDITSRTKTTSTTGSDGRTVVAGGLLSGDSAVRNLAQQLSGAASASVGGFSPSEVGVVVGKDGTFTFDAAKFAAALAKDPAKAQSMVTQVAERVAAVATEASNPTNGTLTLKITGQKDLVKDFGTQIEDWDRRLEMRRTALEKTYSALEVSLSKLNAQSSWLTSQLDALNASKS